MYFNKQFLAFISQTFVYSTLALYNL